MNLKKYLWKWKIQIAFLCASFLITAWLIAMANKTEPGPSITKLAYSRDDLLFTIFTIFLILNLIQEIVRFIVSKKSIRNLRVTQFSIDDFIEIETFKVIVNIILGILLVANILGITIAPTMLFSEAIVGFSSDSNVQIYNYGGDKIKAEDSFENETMRYQFAVFRNNSLFLNEKFLTVDVSENVESFELILRPETKPISISHKEDSIESGFYINPEITYYNTSKIEVKVDEFKEEKKLKIQLKRVQYSVQNPTEDTCLYNTELKYRYRYTKTTFLGDKVVVNKVGSYHIQQIGNKSVVSDELVPNKCYNEGGWN